MLSSSSIACLLASLGEKGLFSTANILQIADVVLRFVSLLFLLFFSQKFPHWLPKQFLNLLPRSFWLTVQFSGADPGFFLGGCALVSCSTSTPINHIVSFFCRIPVVLENCRSSQEGGMLTPCTLPLDPPLVFWQLCCQIDIIFTYCKILPNLVSSCWLWWMTCVILAFRNGEIL